MSLFLLALFFCTLKTRMIKTFLWGEINRCLLSWPHLKVTLNDLKRNMKMIVGSNSCTMKEENDIYREMHIFPRLLCKMY